MNEITVDEVKIIHDGKQDGVLLDVRTPEEYAKAHIEGSVHVPLDELTDKITHVIPDKKTKIYAYCLSGSRSNIAVQYLEELGYSNVYSMIHGLLAWRAKKFPLVGV